MRRAQRLLETTPLSIERIAAEVGFGSPTVHRAHFAALTETSRSRTTARGACDLLSLRAMGEPVEPDAATCARLLGVLGEFIARAGAAPLLLPPVTPGDAAFPDPWLPNRAGVARLLRRLAWHAGLDRAIEVEDREVGERPTERKPATRVPLLEVHPRTARFALEFIGDDDVAGTLAHEIGVAFAVMHPPAGVDPYRSAEQPVLTVDPETDLERGSIAAVYLGLGVLAANAAYQNHVVHERTSFNPMIVLPVGVHVTAGHLPATSITYLLAVQAALRGDRKPPPGLSPEQRDEVAAWLAVLDPATVRSLLAIAPDAVPGERPAVTPFADPEVEPEAPRAKTGFRWRTNRGGRGFLIGAAIAAVAVFLFASPITLLFAFFATFGGHLVGRAQIVQRCSLCATPLAPPADRCHACGAIMRGDISALSERLAAEERLEREAS